MLWILVITESPQLNPLPILIQAIDSSGAIHFCQAQQSVLNHLNTCNQRQQYKLTKQVASSALSMNVIFLTQNKPQVCVCVVLVNN